MSPVSITAASALAPGEQAALATLLAVAGASDGIEHPIQLAPPIGAPADATHYLLARDGGELVGVVGLLGYQEVEAAVVVHPAHRRRGIGRQLIAATRAELARRGLHTWLLVGDAALPGGDAFAGAVGGTRDFAEHRLRLDSGRLPAPAPTSVLVVRPATPADAGDLAALIAAAFGDPIEEVRGWVGQDFAHAERRWFIAFLAHSPVGTLRVREEPEGTYVTGFGVAPAYQGQRLGRQFLLTILAQLRAEGRDPILIEVETNNAPANALYRAVGFAPIRTFDYYRMST